MKSLEAPLKERLNVDLVVSLRHHSVGAGEITRTHDPFRRGYARP